MTRVFIDVVFNWLQDDVRAQHGLRDAHCGAVVVIQRFTSALLVLPHVHALVLDGAYAEPAGDAAPVFHPARAPSADDERAISERVATRMEALIRRRRPASEDLDAQAGAPLERWFQAAAMERAGLRPARARQDSSTGLALGFSTHARVSVRAGDREARERLGRYVCRPPFVAAQVARRDDGQVVFELSRPRRSGETHLVLSPEQWLRRIAWLIPPPRSRTLRAYGVLAPRARLRSTILPVSARAGVPQLSPNALREISPAPQRAYDCARLLARVWSIDVATCAKCGDGPLRPIAAIFDPRAIQKILEHLSVPHRPPASARAPP